MVFLCIDIESIPTQNQAVIDDLKFSINAPANYTKPETIEKWFAENFDAEFDKIYRKTALDGLYGEIISIAWAFDDEEASVVFRNHDESEKELLQAFFMWINTRLSLRQGKPEVISKWIGHYITGFDLRFLWQRCVVNQVKPSVKIPYDAKPWSDDVFDTKIAWTGSSQYSGAGSLDKLCTAFGIGSKGEINGANVYDYWLKKEFSKIADYNKEDVEMCRKLYKLMTFS